jgi:hypothetical protein
MSYLCTSKQGEQQTMETKNTNLTETKSSWDEYWQNRLAED